MGEGGSDVELVLMAEENMSRQEGPWTEAGVEEGRGER